ncbi:MAG: glycerol-3-phosphate 1-O-acyltransferase PlsY [Calditrichia bacterium]
MQKNDLLLLFIAYLIGSFPTAYIFSRLFYRRDIRKAGTGNVGTLNFLRTSGSRLLSALVLLIDLGKGFLALYLAEKYFVGQATFFWPAVGVVGGHVFPIWLKGRGGRGLATLAGVALFLQPILIPAFLLFFLFFWFILKKYITAGILALICVNIVVLIWLPIALVKIIIGCSLIVLYKYLPRLNDEWGIGKQKGV